MTSQAVTLPPGLLIRSSTADDLRVAGRGIELVAERRQGIVAHGVQAAEILVEQDAVDVDQGDPRMRAVAPAGPDDRGDHLARVGRGGELDLDRRQPDIHRTGDWRRR